MRRDRVEPMERAKAAFLEEYRALCERRGFFVIMVSGEWYAVASIFEGDGRKAFAQAMDELRIVPVMETRYGDD